MEWCLLQNQFDSYEKFALLLKVLNVAIVTLSLINGLASIFILALLLVVWLQDAIWKTFQARIESRLLQLETSMGGSAAAEPAVTPFQFNLEYLKGRGGTLDLMVEYGRQACRPTIAYPHLVLAILYGLYLMTAIN
ncbi:MAG: hypothetical protein CME36_15565 [unclassified Hahellaceae]|nr:hypothetical protein [Hahellaceae bacterium]|tara:strand:- start:30528 stop:30935 length:408 start_codon:yes stop_codon:yes gene_type:complete